MNKQRMSTYRDQLRVLAARIGGTLAGLEEGVRTPTGGQAAGGLSNVPLHLGDVGTDAFNQELDATLLENEAFIHDEIAAALERLDHGSYGRCENCGRAIPTARLDALPYVRHCTPCASRLQSGRAVNLNDGRPESWLGAPGQEGPSQTGSPRPIAGRDLGSEPGDTHAAGTPGGGSAIGGLAGTNIGSGAPDEATLGRALGSGRGDDLPEEDEDAPEAFSGRSGGAVGGTPANKRARGGKAEARKPAKLARQVKPRKRG